MAPLPDSLLPFPDAPLPSPDVGSIDGMAGTDGVADGLTCTSVGAALNGEDGDGFEGAALPVCDGDVVGIGTGEGEAADGADEQSDPATDLDGVGARRHVAGGTDRPGRRARIGHGGAGGSAPPHVHPQPSA